MSIIINTDLSFFGVTTIYFEIFYWVLATLKFLCNVIRTLPRDLRAFSRLLKALIDLAYFPAHNYTVANAFDDIVQKKPNKTLLRFEDQSWSAEQIQKFSHKVANFFQQQGYKKGDKVGIFMENCIEYNALWLGLSRIGCISTLVNYVLRLQPLKHCFAAVDCMAIIYSPGLSPAIKELVELGQLDNVSLYCVGQPPKMSNVSKNFLKILEKFPDTAPILSEPLGFLDPLMYIYTSGTTGLPKAATIKMSRYLMAAVINFYAHGLYVEDTIYTALPLYHASGSMLGSGTMLVYGLTQVLRSKFSASNFWKDCIAYNVTAAQYIGEICRYLMFQPPFPMDKSHKVRVMFGNGLKAEIWQDFVERFGIKRISEYYGSTEGNCNMLNIDGKIGAVGFVPLILKTVAPWRLIKVDEVTGEPIRNSKGFVIQCASNGLESGELVGKIRKNHPLSDFEGYADKMSSKDKVLINAFKKGDSWFRSGDIFVMDELGYMYFKDRRGDSFRWKGENCSTQQIEAVISSASKFQDVVVFGVSVPGTEGRAGMAIIADPENAINFQQIASELVKSLPTYARPLFIRITANLEKTGTYKLTKVNYQKVGFDISQTNDKIYFLKGSEYVLLTKEIYDELMAGSLRV